MTVNWKAFNDVSTTPIRILTSVALAAFVVVVAMLGLILGHHFTDTDVHVIEVIGVGVLFMMGLDVTQLFLKRTTDNGYVAAKGDAAAKVAAATQAPVNVGGPSTVTVAPQNTVQSAPIMEASNDTA